MVIHALWNSYLWIMELVFSHLVRERFAFISLHMSTFVTSDLYERIFSETRTCTGFE